MDLKISVNAFNESVLIFKELKDKYKVTNDHINKYFKTEGINFLRRHLKIYGGFDFTKEVFKGFIEKLIENPYIVTCEPMMLKSFKRGYEYVETLADELNSLDTKAIVEKAINIMREYLPKDFEINEEINIYFLYGIRGTAIVYRNEIAIDICSEEIIQKERINEKELINLLAHELHHIAFHIFAEKIKVEKCNNLHEIVKGLFSEGVCSYYITNPFCVETSNTVTWNKNLGNINRLIDDLNKILIKFSEDETLEEKESWYLFDNNLIGYSIGYVMVQTIDQVMGREKIIECVEDYRKFIEYYNNSVREGNLKLPMINIEL